MIAVEESAASELRDRLQRAQLLMSDARLDAIVLSNEANFRYFTGVRSQFFVSPTRPWFVVLPRVGLPVVIVAETARVTMAGAGWISDIRTWTSPRPADEGVTLLAEALRELPSEYGQIGAELGPETRLGMPTGDFLTLSRLIAPARTFVDASAVVAALRRVKSPSEITTLKQISAIVGGGFEALPSLYERGDSVRDVCRKFELEVLRAGAEKAPYLVADSGYDGYRNPVNTPSAQVLASGDVLYIDAGFTLDGYFSDFNRNWVVGKPAPAVDRAYELVYSATDAGIAATRPGVRADEVWQAMARVLESGGGAASTAGRLGHGVGLQLTESPSISSDDRTPLETGMVLTIEPGLIYGSAIMLHEEVVVVTHDGAELITPRAPASIPILDA